ncbi:SMI1/KNR4 family protein [Pseudomonas sp. ADAK2]|uniref:SMI1/KNR4 family protein n=1 Tax=unclassified Pseudomonas TaxID=196821 RepID=UPI001462A453|nr:MULTISPECIES: SMI1/KNR4 family protein [unclassified Pseudomonas]QJI39403.1 SMI1/KNR4 family protein [Pseudomonas sp. ADAK7]QJI45709.1 SMI1/KNR4 family protein [Pseudomonas sp. ADAK2]
MTIKYTETKHAASAKSVNDIIQTLGVDRDVWIVKFWSRYDGALLNDQVLMYSTDDIVERNQTYEVGINFPEQVLIGDDSGGRLILIDKAISDVFYLIDSGDPFLGDAVIFHSIDELMDNISGEETDLSATFNIVAIASDKPTPQEVLAIKKGLGLSFSITDLKGKLEKRNEVILSDVKIVKYEAIVKAYNHLIRFDS